MVHVTISCVYILKILKMYTRRNIQDGNILLLTVSLLDGYHEGCGEELKSRLTVVSLAAKQRRARNTTVCYIHERSILIERSPKAYCKNYLMKKQRALLKPLTIIW